MYYIVSLCILLLVITGTAELIDCRTKRCLYETVMCDDDRPCIVDCAYDDGDYFGSQEACESSLIHCPVNGTCEVRCDGPEACQDARIDATHSAQLNITCNGHFESCYGVKIFCPHAGNCIITAKNTVEHPDAFVSVDIFAANALDNMNLSMSLPQQSNVTIYCGSGDQYTQCQEHQQCNESASPCAELLSSQLNATILPSTVGSTFDCYSDECRYLTLKCIENTQCNVACTSSQSCRLTNIYCSTNASCVVTCDADAACEYMNIYAGDAAEVRLTCYNHTRSCYKLEVFCPTSAQSCIITAYNDDLFWVSAKKGIQVVRFNRSSLPRSNVEFWCGYRLEYRCNLDNVFHCDAPMPHSTNCYHDVQCERNKTCEVICDSPKACQYTYIDARYAKELTVTCNNYASSCNNTRIFCPEEPKRCNIKIYNTMINVLDEMKIFTVNGSNDVALSAAQPLQSVVLGYCLDNPQIDLCIITPLRECFSKCFEFAQAPSYFPTISPTKTSIYPTTNPTVVPTIVPSAPIITSIYPTANPTMASTQSTDKPTLDPTLNPTAYPSNKPTSDPTMEPTSNPTMEPSSNPTRKQRDIYVEVVETYETSISLTIANNENTPHQSYNIIRTVLVVVPSVITFFVICFIVQCHWKQKKKKREQVKENKAVSKNVDSIKDGVVEIQQISHYNNDVDDIKLEESSQKDERVQDHKNHHRIKYVFDNDTDEEVIELDQNATVGQGIGAVMRDDEFEVIGVDDSNPEGEGTTAKQ
eukprot:442340_1